MPGRDFNDHPELRPLGEATHVPDHELGTGRTDRWRDPRRSCPPTDDGSARECRSCGASIPASRTKCQFCLSNHVELLGVDDVADEMALLHVIHMVIPAVSHYAAVAKGTTARYSPRSRFTVLRAATRIVRVSVGRV